MAEHEQQSSNSAPKTQVEYELDDPHRARGTSKMVEMAIRKGWLESIPAEQANTLKRGVVTTMAGIVANSKDKRQQIAAARVLVQADQADAQHRRIDEPQKLDHNHEMGPEFLLAVRGYAQRHQIEERENVIDDDYIARVVAETPEGNAPPAE